MLHGRLRDLDDCAVEQLRYLHGVPMYEYHYCFCIKRNMIYLCVYMYIYIQVYTIHKVKIKNELTPLNSPQAYYIYRMTELINSIQLDSTQLNSTPIPSLL